MPDSAGSPLLRVGEVAALLRVPLSRVYAWTSRIGPDAIPRYRAGKHLVFLADEVLAWFRETQPTGVGPLQQVRRTHPARGVKRRGAEIG